ncbi:hypothetical protein V1291_000801 [Nitrobacteraceae bacterium AZCC 1564]
MSDQLHPMAPHHLPFFITAPGDPDWLTVIVGALLIAAVLGIGNLYLRLHSLPERMAHKSQKLQFEIVAILGLLALFTHIHLFWIAGLLLAFIDIPDFGTPLRSIAGSVEKIADQGEAGATAAAADTAGPTAPPLEGKASVRGPKAEEHSHA